MLRYLPPELPPVTNTLLASTLYCEIAYVIILEMAWVSPPPPCVKVALLDTSQHVPL